MSQFSRFQPRSQARAAAMPQENPFAGTGAATGASVSYLQQVYAFLAAGMFLAVVAGYVGMTSEVAYMMRGNILISLGALLGTMILVSWKPSAPTLFLMTGTWGFMGGPVIAMYVNAGASHIVGQAAFMTGAIFTAMTFYAMTTKRDFSFMGGMLMAGFVVILVGGLLNFFIFESPAVTFALSAVGALIMTGFLLYETQMIKQNPGIMHPAAAAASLFATIYNLFMMLLQLLGIMNSDD
ncbi:Bax inhibitor-1/YccA family protein [Magnetococcus sp. PR-3]|uniref:Bax inhibitor-1/YccA family protein n=1 Tax=Magnetococcus sp. PR-3 TaxID=3120355 RepID=UPI002FCE36C9